MNISFEMTTLPETYLAAITIVGKLLSFWDGLFSGAFAVSFREGKPHVLLEFCSESLESWIISPLRGLSCQLTDRWAGALYPYANVLLCQIFG